MKLANDGPILISTAGSRQSVSWVRQNIAWSDFLTKLSKSKDTGETRAVFMKMSKDQQNEIKDTGAFVGGVFTGDRRAKNAVQSRSLVTLDADSIVGGIQAFIKKVNDLGFAYAAYSTHKHTSQHPRTRVVFPLSESVAAEICEAISRKLAEMIGINVFDPTTHEANRLFFWPSNPVDVKPFFTYQDRPFIHPDEFLKQNYEDWTDVLSWPRSNKEQTEVKRLVGKQKDPTKKDGPIGEFCRAYRIPEAINKFLFKCYVPGQNGRYTYAKGSTANGLIVYDNGLFAYSHHSTDPASGRLCNAYDLVRIHLYGSRNQDEPIDQRGTKDMMQLIDKDERVEQLRAENDFQESAVEQLGKRSKAKKMVDLVAQSGADLFHTANDESYITMKYDGLTETNLISSSAVKGWMRLTYADKYKDVIGRNPVNDATDYLSDLALKKGKERLVFTRVAQTDTAIYIDLCNEERQIVRVQPGGVDVLDDSPVKFVRIRGMNALPIPDLNGRIDDLRPFLNYEDENDFRLLVGWLVGSFRTQSAAVFLMLQGEQGSAKSTVTKVLKALADPSEMLIRSLPEKEDDLILSVRNAWLPAYDNISGLSKRMSDLFCQVSTGSSFGTRKLYTNNEETTFSVKRPIIFNGIEDVATRPDLLSRSIVITLPPITGGHRKDEELFDNQFEIAKPRIFGALCKALSEALREKGNVKIKELPRMTSFVKFVTAAEKSLGWPEHSFLAAFNANQGEASEQALDAESIVPPLIALMTSKEHWEGTASDLVNELYQREFNHPDMIKRLPTPRTIKGRLTRLAPILKEKKGIDISFNKTRSDRLIVLTKLKSIESKKLVVV